MGKEMHIEEVEEDEVEVEEEQQPEKKVVKDEDVGVGREWEVEGMGREDGRDRA